MTDDEIVLSGKRIRVAKMQTYVALVIFDLPVPVDLQEQMDPDNAIREAILNG